MDNNPKPKILVCGKTGAGKTSLVRSATKAGTVPDDAIGHGGPTTSGHHVYETEVATFVDIEGMVPGQAVDDYFTFLDDVRAEVGGHGSAARLEAPPLCWWYCVDGSGARVQPADAAIINKLQRSAPVLAVVTKSDLMRREQTEGLLSGLAEVLPPEHTVMISNETEAGLEVLVKKTEAVIQDAIAAAARAEAFAAAWDAYYQEKTAHWRRLADDEAESVILWGAGRAAAIAVVPLPLADVLPLAANEAYMIYRIGAAYGVAVDKTIIAGLLGILGASAAGKTIASFLPGLKIAIAAGVTHGVGKAAKAYFASGMTLDPATLSRIFNQFKNRPPDTLAP